MRPSTTFQLGHATQRDAGRRVEDRDLECQRTAAPEPAGDNRYDTAQRLIILILGNKRISQAVCHLLSPILGVPTHHRPA